MEDQDKKDNESNKDGRENKNKYFSPRNYDLDRANTSHALILALVGAYLVFMIYMIVNNYINGETSMRLSTVVIVTIVMCAIAAAIFAYAAYVFYISRNRDKYAEEQEFDEFDEAEEETEPEMHFLTNDLESGEGEEDPGNDNEAWFEDEDE